MRGVLSDQNPPGRFKNTIAIRYVMFNGRLYDAKTLAEITLSDPAPRTNP